jgi:hypothetical protein
MDHRPKKANLISMESEIGTAAGTVWRYLEQHGQSGLAELARGTKLSDRLLCMALGWLARETKVEFVRGAKTVRVSLRT